MNAEKRRKLLDLEAMRRRLPHVSQRALSATLKDVKQHGLPELDHRNHFNEARELLMNEKTQFLYQDQGAALLLVAFFCDLQM